MNQVELHPYLPQEELKAFCDENEIYLTAYSPLGSAGRPDRMKASDEPSLLNHPKVIAIGEGIEATPAQVLIAWAISRGTVVIPKSTNLDRVAKNYAGA